MVKEAVLSVKKDIFKKVIEETDAKKEEKVDGKMSSDGSLCSPNSLRSSWTP